MAPTDIDELAAAFRDVLDGHRLLYGPRGQICSCGFVQVPPGEVGITEGLRTQQDYHREHIAWRLALAVDAALPAPAPRPSTDPTGDTR